MGGTRTIFQKGLILVSVPMLFQLAFIGVLFWMQGQNAEAQRRAYHSQEVLTQAHAVLGSVVDAQTGMRGWVITDDPVFAEPYERAVRELPEQLALLQNLVQDNPEQKAQVGRIAAKAEESLRWNTELIQLMRAGRRDEAIVRAKTREGKRRMDELRQEMAAFLAEEERVDRERGLHLEQSRRSLSWLLLAAGLAALLTTGALAVVFNRGISGRLAVLTDNVRRLARGEELAPTAAGRDEIAQLDQSFRDTAAELARSRQSLQDQMEILQSILNSMGEGVVVADQAGRFLIFNPAATRLFGKGRTDSPPEQWPQEYGLYLPDGRTPLPADQLPLLRAVRGESVDDVELLVRHAGAEGPSWVTVTGRPLGGSNGDLRGGVVVCRDITERKLAEDALRRFNDELEKRVRDRTAELTTAVTQLGEANRDLAQKNAENEMFVYSVSHDLRSPLVNLQGFSKELEKGCQQLATVLEEAADLPAARDRVRGLLGGKMTRSLGFIQSAVLRLSNIIDALLGLSRAGRVEYRWAEVDLAGVVARVIQACHGTAVDKGARVEVGELPPAWGDASALEQVFANLIGNALAYLDPARPGVIEVGCLPAAESGFRTYYVRDNGLGIAEGHQAKIFQMFQRAHPGVGKGEGIGLAIVARVAERHRGKVWVESRAGEGSTFFVTLPTEPGKGPTR